MFRYGGMISLDNLQSVFFNMRPTVGQRNIIFCADLQYDVSSSYQATVLSDARLKLQ
jgi:hypothetical protein